MIHIPPVSDICACNLKYWIVKMSVKEGAAAQTMPSSASQSRKNLVMVVQHTAFLSLAVHSCALLFFYNSWMYYSSVIFPHLGVVGFSIKCDIANDNPRQVICSYALIFVWLSAINVELIQFSWLESFAVIMGQNLKLLKAPISAAQLQ